jgi:hypothetical protein
MMMRMKTSRRRLIGAVVLIVAAIAVAGALGHDSGSSYAKLSRFSTGGQPITLARKEARVARLMGADAVFLLARRADRAYYRITGSQGTCFGAGPAEKVGFITGEACPAGSFPTRGRPVLDYSVYEAMSHDRSGGLSLYRAEGFAADGVASVAFLRPNGEVALRIPVRGNVFSAAAPPRGPVAVLVAYDSTGQEVWRSG